MYDATLAETVTIRGDGGDEIEAYLARPMSQGPFGGVVVIHHMPGYDAPTKEIARRFGPISTSSRTCPAHCSACSARTTSTRRPSRWTNSKKS